MSETASKPKGGRPADPNKLRFVSIGLRPEDLAYLRLFGPNPDDGPVEPGSDLDNPTALLGELLRHAKHHWPNGPAFTRPRRGSGPNRGHWMSNAEIEAERSRQSAA